MSFLNRKRFLGKPVTALSQNHVKAALTLNTDAQKNEEDAYMTQMVLTAAGYMANGGVGMAIVGTLVCLLLLHLFFIRSTRQSGGEFWQQDRHSMVGTTC